MPIKSKAAKTLGVLLLVSVSGPTASHAWYRWRTAPRFDTAPHPSFPTAELAALDRDVQERFFLVAHRDFGYWRIMKFTHDVYRPVTPREKADVAALRAQHVDVLFYTMARNGVLWGAGMSQIKGPGFMTGPPNQLPLLDEQSATDCEQALIDNQHLHSLSEPGSVQRPDLPELTDLSEVGERILSPTATSPAVASSGDQWCALPSGNWKVVAVPVLASSQRCIDCHRQFDPGQDHVKLGDPLGAAIYAYRTMDESAPQPSSAS